MIARRSESELDLAFLRARGRVVDLGAGDLRFTREAETAQAFETASLWNIRGGLAICESALAMLSGKLEHAAQFSRQANHLLVVIIA